jgi:hypothetical protein
MKKQKQIIGYNFGDFIYLFILIFFLYWLAPSIISVFLKKIKLAHQN